VPTPTVLAVPGTIAAASYSAVSPSTVTTYSPAAGVTALNNLSTGSVVTYPITVAQAGSYSLEVQVSQGNWTPTPQWHAEVDGANLTGAVPIPSTGSWSTYQWVSGGTVALTAGTHTLKIVSDQQYFNLAAVRTATVSACPVCPALPPPCTLPLSTSKYPCVLN
jgi:hypothetical protein